MLPVNEELMAVFREQGEKRLQQHLQVQKPPRESFPHHLEVPYSKYYTGRLVKYLTDKFGPQELRWDVEVRKWKTPLPLKLSGHSLHPHDPPSSFHLIGNIKKDR